MDFHKLINKSIQIQTSFLYQSHLIQMATPRFNLRNASLYLTKLKNKYHKPNEEENVYDRTFIDEEDEEFTSDPSIKRLSGKKIDSNTERYEFNNEAEQSQAKQAVPKDKPQQTDPTQNPTFPPTQQPQPQCFSHLPTTTSSPQTEFCDLIIIKYLQQTLSIYKSDLSTLQHNRQNLQQQIYFIGKKIGKLHQMQAENAKMQAEVQLLNERLKQVIGQYHESNKRVYGMRLKVDRVLRKWQGKVRGYLLLGRGERVKVGREFQGETQGEERRSDAVELEYVRPDLKGAAYIDEYENFINFKIEQSNKINENLNKNPEEVNKEKDRFVKALFLGKEKIYLNVEEKIKQTIGAGKKGGDEKLDKIIEEQEKKNDKKVVLYDEFEQDQKQKQMEQQKPKKLSEAEKSLLLGDLKNFSKSFKLPNK